LAHLLGPRGARIAVAMEAGRRFLGDGDPGRLLPRLGEEIAEIPAFVSIDKSPLPAGYGGGCGGGAEDFLVGQGLFYVNERRRLLLDCTSGHYQVLWGYGHRDLTAALVAAQEAGVVWDNHSNIPQAPVKRLAERLVTLGNAPGEADPLDTVLLGVCTGSVACAAALKIQLKVFARAHGTEATPVLVALRGNYHGTDMVAQGLRGLWPGLLRRCEVVVLEPNDAEALDAVFRERGSRIAGFWAEPVMMNREAVALEPGYLARAEAWCRETGALLCLDEIQTGFWLPEMFEYRRLGLRPDLVVLGKGLTAGFHPLSGLLLRRRHDVLEQYDAISTNGSAALPALVALASIEMIEGQAARIRDSGVRIQAGLRSLVSEFPGVLLAAEGRGHLAGLKFRSVAGALEFHRRLLEAGLWTRVHAYHEGHSTLLTKLGLLADAVVIDGVMDRMREVLRRGSPCRPSASQGTP